jgi:peptidyl-prolyl cis-trans isomerase B (cyclophilin B)
VKKIEGTKTASGDKPLDPIKISKSGELEVPDEGIRAEL